MEELSSRVTKDKFYLEVSVEEAPQRSAPTTKSLPFVPSGFDLSTDDAFAKRLANLSNISVTLYLDRLIKKKQQELLRVIVKNSLSAVGDKLRLRIKTMSFPASSIEEAYTRQQQVLQRKISDLTSREKTLESEREDAKRSLARTKADLERAKENARKVSAPKQVTLGETLAKSIVWIVLGSLAILAMIGGALFLRAGLLSSSATLATSFSQIARAVGEINQGAGGEVIDIAPESDQALLGGGQQALTAGGDTANFPRLYKLREELFASLSQVDEQYTLHNLNQMLSSSADALRGVYVMELMPREVARHLFEKLGAKQKAFVVKFLMAKEHPKNKAELMLAAGEEFITKLLKGHLGAIEEHLSQAIITKLEQLATEQLSQLTKQLGSDAGVRLLLYLRPAVISELLSQLKAGDQKTYEKLAVGFAAIAEFEERSELDQEIEKAIDQLVALDAADKDKKYLPLFREVLAGLDDDHTENLIKVIEEKKRDLGAQLSQTVVTINTYFKLSEDHQAELLEGFSNRDLAALISILSDEQNVTFQNLLDERRLELLIDEKERLEQKSSKEIHKLASVARKKLVSRLQALVKESGSLDQLLGEGSQEDESYTEGQAA